MLSLKVLLVFCVILSVCCADAIKKKKHKHKYELYWHGFHYLTFLALKFKALFVLGSIFVVGVIAGKIYAVIKFAEYMKKSPEKHAEKVVYVSPHHGSFDDHGPPHSFSAPGPVYGKSHGDSHHDSFPPGFAVDQLPPGAQISDGGGGFNGFGGNYGSGPGNMYNGQSHGYGRSNTVESYSIYKYFKLFRDMIKRLNVTNIAFNDMNLKTDLCRRKFVCEADFNSKRSILLSSAFDMFSDDNYARYKTNKNITSIEECNQLYPNCSEVT